MNRVLAKINYVVKLPLFPIVCASVSVNFMAIREIEKVNEARAQEREAHAQEMHKCRQIIACKVDGKMDSILDDKYF